MLALADRLKMTMGLDLYFLVRRHQSVLVPVPRGALIKVLFSSQNFLVWYTVALLFLFDNYYSIMDYIYSKDLSHNLKVNCTVSFCFICHKIRCDKKS